MTVARVPRGGIQERDVGDRFAAGGNFTLIMNQKDSTISRRVKETIDRKFGEGWAKIENPGQVLVTVPRSMRDDPVSFAATIEDLTLSLDQPNRVVLNERTGTLIVGNKVRISHVMISHGSLRIEVAPPTTGARTGRPGAGAKEPAQGSLITLKGETTVDDLVKALNAIGATPKDLISIFQAVQAAGALHGELKIM